VPFKLTIFFTSFRYAWSEAYYNLLTFGNPQQVVKAQNLCSLRGACLGNNASLYAARVSNFPANRQIDDVDITQSTSTGDWSANTPNVENPTDIANRCIVLKSDTAVGSKLIYLAGAPEGVNIADQQPPYNVSPNRVSGFSKILNRFINELQTGGWGCRSWKATVAIQAIGITQGTQNPPLIGVELATNPNWPVNSKVLLGGWRRTNPRSPGLSGVFTVQGVPLPTQVNPPFIYYLWGTANVNPNNFKTIGTIGLVQYQIVTFQGFLIDKGTTRKRGVRTLAPLGKFSRVH